MVGYKALRGIAIVVLVCGMACLGLVSCSSSGADREAGVITTGNAGRVRGDIRFQGDSTQDVPLASVTLQILRDTGWVEVGSMLSDDSGAYLFDELGAGTYRVLAVATTGERGASSAFQVEDGQDVRVVVVLLRVTKVVLLYVPPAGEQVLSVRVEGTGAEGVHGAAGWTLDLQDGSSDTLLVILSSGALRYAVVWEGGTPSLLPVDDAPAVELVRLLADWTFDESDTLRDHSGRGNVGIRHGGAGLLAGESAWRFDGRSGYVDLGACLGWEGACVDWSDTDLVLQMRVRLDTQTVSVVAHLVTISAGNGEVMVKRIPGDTVAVVLAAPSGWYGCNIPWKSRLGQWVDLVFVRDADAGEGRVYLDGQLYRTFEVPHVLNKVAGIRPALGVYTSGGALQYFARMDLERMRVWLGAFDGAQVLKLHQSL